MWYIGQSLIAIDDRGLIIRWEKSDAEDFDGYHVYMKEGEYGSFERMTDKTIFTEEWESPPLRRDVAYEMYVTVVDTSDNESEKSNIVRFELRDAEHDPTVVFIPKPATKELNQNESLLLHLSHSIETKDIMTQFRLGGLS